MVSFFNVLGVVFWVLGLVTCSAARGAMHETNGMVQVAIGTVCLVGAALLDEMRRQRPPPPPPILGPGDKAPTKARGSQPAKLPWWKFFI